MKCAFNFKAHSINMLSEGSSSTIGESGLLTAKLLSEKDRLIGRKGENFKELFSVFYFSGM